MRTTLLKQAFVCVTASVTAVLIGGGIASAHIDPDPLAMQAGTSGTVAFKIEHGCDGSPTTSVKFEIPEGVTDVAAVDKPGWTATLTGNVLEFTGGPLAADQEDHFDLTLTAPSTAGEIHFPVIQTCEQGELAWIEIAEEGAAEPEHPAPTLKITDGPPTSADLTPEEETAGSDDSGTAETSGAAETSGTAETGGTLVISPAPASDDSSNTGVIVAVVAGVVVVVVGGGLVLARRRRSTPQS